MRSTFSKPYAVASIFWMVFIFLLSQIPDLKSDLPSQFDYIFRKFAHAGEFAVLYLLVRRALGESKNAMRNAVIVALLYAGFDEWHQSFIFGRVASLKDVGIDAIGIAVGFLFEKIQGGKRK